MSDAPKENLVRALLAPPPAELRAKDDDGDGGLGTLAGHFAVFDEWTQIESWWEGRFLERIAPGAFKRTIKENRARIKVLYDHGMDPTLGNKPLGPIDVLKEDDKGARYEVPLIDTDYNRGFIVPAATAGLLGASFRFSVVKEEWNEKPAKSKANPDRLPERSITDVDLYEFGPVTFPAYEGATAGMRSGTDAFLDCLAHDPRFVARLTERTGAKVVEQIIDALPADGHGAEQSPPATVDDLVTRAARQQFARRTVAWAITPRKSA